MRMAKGSHRYAKTRKRSKISIILCLVSVKYTLPSFSLNPNRWHVNLQKKTSGNLEQQDNDKLFLCRMLFAHHAIAIEGITPNLTGFD